MATPEEERAEAYLDQQIIRKAYRRGAALAHAGSEAARQANYAGWKALRRLGSPRSAKSTERPRDGGGV